ncbi:MAG: Nif11 family protein [Actinomycetota bacterium]
MSVELAQGLVRRLATDADFRARLEGAATPAEGRAILRAEGFGDVALAHMSAALPEHAGGELSDEEFAAVAGGSHTTTALTIAAGGGGAVSLASLVAGVAALGAA